MAHSARSAIKFQNVSKPFGSVQALHKLSFTVPLGQMLALLDVLMALFFSVMLLARQQQPMIEGDTNKLACFVHIG